MTATTAMPTATTAVETASTELHLSPELRAELAGWVTRGHPSETCGLLIGRERGAAVEVERVIEARNLNRERAGDRYQLDPDDFAAADSAARRDQLDIVGIWHSHPDCPARPSTTDLEAAWPGYSYLIIAVTGDGDTDFHSWRLEGAETLFRKERILPDDPRPVAAALRFENPLKEERPS